MQERKRLTGIRYEIKRPRLEMTRLEFDILEIEKGSKVRALVTKQYRSVGAVKHISGAGEAASDTSVQES